MVIRRYGLLNGTIPAGERSHGVPWPGTLVLDRERRVVARYFEERYQERNTAASILTRLGAVTGAPQWTGRSRHLSVVAGASDERVAPGARVTLAFDVTPARGIHIYAPGAEYQVVTIDIDPHPHVAAHDIVYPASETYHFAPLNETVPVYQRPFRLTRDVTVAATREAQQALREAGTIAVSGRLAYQACDDKVCYAPASIPFVFTLKVREADR